jgi:hypothetical protein
MLARSAEQDGLTPAPDPAGNKLSPCLCAACMTSHNSMPKDKVGPLYMPHRHPVNDSHACHLYDCQQLFV